MKKLVQNKVTGENAKIKRNARLIGENLNSILLQNRTQKGSVRYGLDVLRQSEQEGIHETARFLRNGITSGHIIQPGGTGKTHEIVMLSDAAYQNKRKVLIVVPTIEGVDNVVNRFKRLAPHIVVGSVYGQAKDYRQAVTVMTYASLLINIAKETIDPQEYSLLIADEGHHFLTELSDEALDKFTHAVKIAFSATPRYYAGKELAASRHFGQLFYNLTYKEAIERKECAKTKSRLIDTNIPMDEYERLFANGIPPSEDGGAYEHAINQVPWNQTFADLYGFYSDDETGHRLVGDKTLVFCAGIQHAKDISGQFNDMLMPYINGRSKNTKKGRAIQQALQAKGINPNEVKYACAPVWGSMDKEGGWASKPTHPSYTRKELMQAFIDGQVLSLSCDKLLAESIDIPAITTILNAAPTCSFVRAGQRGMRAGRIFNGSRSLGIPPKHWAYVFDALPLNWQTSLAGPVLFSEFVLKDLYTMHGIEPPRVQRSSQDSVSEHNPGYRVLWDIQSLLSIGTMLETRRSIPKAEVVPPEFLNDSLAVRELLLQHEKLPSETRRFIGGLFKDWEQSYEDAGRPNTGLISRYKYSIPAEHLRFANNRLYVHRQSMPVIWAEREEFRTRSEMVKILEKEGCYVSRTELDEFGNLLWSFWAGEYQPQEEVIAGGWISKEDAERRNRVIQKNNRERMRWLPEVRQTALRSYEGKDFLSVDLLPILSAELEWKSRRLDYIEKMQARAAALSGWRAIVPLTDLLADQGFVGLGRDELFAHAAAAARAAEKSRRYGGERFFPGEFQFSSKRGDDEPTHLPSGEVVQVRIRTNRVQSFIEALRKVNPPTYEEPSKFPAKISECYPFFREASGRELSWKEFGGIISRMLDRDNRDRYTNRQARLKAAFDLSRDDIILPKSSDGHVRLTRHGYESFKRLFAMRPPDGFVQLANVSTHVEKLLGPISDWRDFADFGRVKKILEKELATDLDRVGTVEIAGIFLPLEDIWRRDPYENIAYEKVIDDKGIAVSPRILPKIVRLEVAIVKSTQEIDRAFRGVLKTSKQTVKVQDITIPVCSHYFSSNKLLFRIHELSDALFFKITKNILEQMDQQAAVSSSSFYGKRQTRRVSRIILQGAQS